MNRIYRKWIVPVICILMITAFTACQEGGIFVNNDENGNAYKLSDEITLASCTLRSINPLTSPDNDFYQLSKLAYDGLVTLDDTLAPQPALAEGWQTDGERGTVTFTLKSGLTFSDGTNITTKDVVFSLEACKKSETSPYAAAVSRIKNAEASGDYTVVFTVSSSTNISIADFVFPIVSSAQFSKTQKFLENADTPVIGCGAYRITSADLKNELIFEANPNYYGKKPSNTIYVHISPVSTPYTGFVESGELSMVVETATDREDISTGDKMQLTEFTSNEAEVLGFNCSSGPCADRKLRLAIANLVDIDSIKKTAYYNSGTRSDDLYFPGYCGTEINNPFKCDKEKAAEYLSAAGYQDTDGDGILENGEGVELQLTLIYNADNLCRKTAAELLAYSCLNSGIRLNRTEVSTEYYSTALASGNFDMFLGGWKIAENYDLRSFYHTNYSNPAQYSNPKLDTLLDQLQSGVSGEEQQNLLNDTKKILQDEVPYLCLLYKTYAAISSANLEGVIAPRFNQYYYACDDWKMRVYKKADTSGEDDGTTGENGESNNINNNTNQS